MLVLRLPDRELREFANAFFRVLRAGTQQQRFSLFTHCGKSQNRGCGPIWVVAVQRILQHRHCLCPLLRQGTGGRTTHVGVRIAEQLRQPRNRFRVVWLGAGPGHAKPHFWRGIRR